jgi:hypothetical protein
VPSVQYITHILCQRLRERCCDRCGTEVLRCVVRHVWQHRIPQIIALAPNMYTFPICLQKNVCSEHGCVMVFIEKRHLKAHMRWHDGLQEYMCDRTDCEMAFETKYALEQHMRTHTGEKPFKCDFCKKCFSQSGSLKRHKKIHIQ